MKIIEKRHLVYICLSLVVLLIILVQISRINLTGNIVFSPLDCSNQAMASLWNAVFEENSSGINIWTNNLVIGRGCSLYFLWKIKSDNNTFFIIGKNYETSGDFEASHVLLPPGIASQFRNINNLSGFYNLGFYVEDLINRTSSINSITEADTLFNQIFKENNGTWSKTLDYYYFEVNSSNYFENSSLKIRSSGSVYPNYTAETYSIYEEIVSFCTPNWTAQNTSCSVNEEKTIYYADLNNCNINTDKPGNETIDCDYNNNGVIGNFSLFLGFNIYIDSELGNNSKIYNETEKIEIKDNGTTIIEFYHNFSSPLNIKDIEIIKQTNLSFGYLIVNGIDDEKIFVINKLSTSSNAVCIKNAYVSSISGISQNCTSSKEDIVNCPGNKDNFTCSISGNYFIVSGLINSGVKEFQIISCTPNWNCTNWSGCVNGMRLRSCIDTSSCGTNASKPAISETCTEIPLCTPSWNCTNWGECSEDEIEIRICKDNNNCNLNATKPDEKRDCDYNPGFFKKNLLWIFLITGVIGIVILVILIMINSKRNSENMTLNRPSNFPPSSPAFSAQPPQPPMQQFQAPLPPQF